MASGGKAGITALMGYTLCVTIARGVRVQPNDFAEAQWLLGYQFGFVKRGLVGELLRLASRAGDVPITAAMIAILAQTAFAIFAFVMLAVSLRTVRNAGWSSPSALVALAFLSSPFFVMSGHLMGYYDNLVMILGVLSLVLLLRGRPWLGAVLQAVAILVHELAILVVFPAYVLAWLLDNARRVRQGQPRTSVIPLLLPALVFVVVLVSQELLLSADFRAQYTTWLQQYPFVENDRSTLVPMWISTPFSAYLRSQGQEFVYRITLGAMHVLALPTTLMILVFCASAYRIREFSVEFMLITAVCFVPQLMHLLADDTPRIWTYTMFCAGLVLWVYSETSDAIPPASVVRLLALATIVANIDIVTPLFDGQVDHLLKLSTRELLYAPTLLGCVALLWFDRRTSAVERLALQGQPLRRLLSARAGDAAGRTEH